MEHNSYNKDVEKEVVLVILQGENHVRGIAKMLNINHMTISRMLKRLMVQNVVDYKVVGKNKVYSLKDVVEGHVTINKAEQHKLRSTLQRYPQLRLIIEEIRKLSEIKLAILFGSYAKGTAKEDSDIDIYIESENLKLKKKIEEIDTRVSVKLGKYDKENLLIKEIQKNHVIIKGVDEYYERKGFFD